MYRVKKFMPDGSLDRPATDISVAYSAFSIRDFIVTLHTSTWPKDKNRDEYRYDLEINFGSCLEVHWHDEFWGCVGLEDALITKESVISITKGFADFCSPILVVEESPLVQRYVDIFKNTDYTAVIPVHYMILALNDHIHLLTKTVPTFKNILGWPYDQAK